MASPQAKKELIVTLIAHLYRKVNAINRRKLNQLILDNSTLHGNYQSYMSYGSEIYTYSGADKHYWKDRVNQVHPQILAPLREYLREQKQLQAEQSIAIGYIQRIMLASNNRNDFVELLPEPLHSKIREPWEFFDAPLKEMCPEFKAAFISTNAHYLTTLKTRLLHDLIAA